MSLTVSGTSTGSGTGPGSRLGRHWETISTRLGGSRNSPSPSKSRSALRHEKTWGLPRGSRNRNCRQRDAANRVRESIPLESSCRFTAASLAGSERVSLIVVRLPITHEVYYAGRAMSRHFSGGRAALAWIFRLPAKNPGRRTQNTLGRHEQNGLMEPERRWMALSVKKVTDINHLRAESRRGRSRY